ncbi:MAG: histidine kinase [Chitinophagaceae bacterium]|nr:histidine kinase [Rubrivivax sp.]
MSNNIHPAPRPWTWRRLWMSPNTGSLGIAVGFAFTVALLIKPIFVISFSQLLARTLLLSLLLLLTFRAAQRLPERWLPAWFPRWLLTALAVGLAAPLGTLALYLASSGGSIDAFVNNSARVRGFVIIASSALVLGLVISLTALLREREARARTLALELELERSRIEKQAADARLARLQAQIEPHFLFNTLANVQALVDSQSPRAATVLKSLVAYLRAAMPRLDEALPTLGHEVGLVRAYLELMQMRMPDRLAWTVDVDPALHAQRLPPMALLTLVENAVGHGIDPLEGGGRIDVGARRDAMTGRLHLWVADTGAGLTANAQPGTGLANLRARLQAVFGAAAELVLTEQVPHGVRAEIVLPT